MRIINIYKTFLLILGGFLFLGCSSIKVKTEPYYAGKILIFSISDAVHEKGGSVITGSGAAFQKLLADNFLKSEFKAIVSSNKKEATAYYTGLKEVHESGAFYGLRVDLGELHIAKTGTRRPDYAYLEHARMYNLWTGEVVWQLSKPLYAEKSNPGNPSILFKMMAAFVSDSIVGNSEPNVAGGADKYKASSINRYYRRKGVELVKQRKLGKAIQYFELALKYDPEDEDAKKAIHLAKERL